MIVRVFRRRYKLNIADRTDIERIIGTGEDDNTINTFDATIGPNIRIDNKVSIICLDSNDTMYFAQNIDRGSYSSYSTYAWIRKAVENSAGQWIVEDYVGIHQDGGSNTMVPIPCQPLHHLLVLYLNQPIFTIPCSEKPSH